MNDGYQSKDIFFAVGLLYVFGEQALLKIETEGRETVYTLDAPSLDCSEFRTEYDAKTFAISDLATYVKIYNRVIQILKRMRASGDTVYCSPTWIVGRG